MSPEMTDGGKGSPEHQCIRLIVGSEGVPLGLQMVLSDPNQGFCPPVRE